MIGEGVNFDTISVIFVVFVKLFAHVHLAELNLVKIAMLSIFGDAY